MRESGDRVRYPVGLQSFPEVISGGYVYVDKTAYVHKLGDEGKYYFLSRPRRFGKSLFISTLEAYYLGRRELFKGLALDSMTDDWEPHPVFRLDMNARDYKDECSLYQQLNAALERWEAEFGCDYPDRQPEERFGNVIRKAFRKTGKKVVILIDEYDKPLLDTIERPEIADSYRATLKAFYANLKSLDEFIELGMITGVAKFSKVSIFSDLNNLRDISFENEYAAICGITNEELVKYFGVGIRELAHVDEVSEKEMLAMLQKHYDGYHFAKRSPDIFNPFSLINAFAKRDIGSYWFETGTPTYLVNLVRKIGRPFKDIAPYFIEDQYLETAGLLDSNPIPVFYQSGYLTIRSFSRSSRLYELDYPNEEVKKGFLGFLMREYIPDMQSNSGFSIPDFLHCVNSGDADGFMKAMESLVASVPYHEKYAPEAHFQNVVYLLFTLLGFSAQMEQRTSDGRIDVTLETSRSVFIFEFKINGSAADAMKQINDKKYWLRYNTSGKEIILIGAGFDSRTRRLDGYDIKIID